MVAISFCCCYGFNVAVTFPLLEYGVYVVFTRSIHLFRGFWCGFVNEVYAVSCYRVNFIAAMVKVVVRRFLS